MMENDVIVCDGCFERIGKMNAPAAALWIDICEMIGDGQLMSIEAEDFEEMRILELLGHIVTSETDSKILVRLKGEKDYYFCNGECDG